MRKKWTTNVHSSTLKFVLFSRKLCYLHCIFLYNSFLLSFSVTDFLYRNHYSSLTPFFVRVLIPLPFQYFWKYDRDYPADDKTHKTLAQFFARKHFLFFYKLMLRSFAEEIRVENGQTKPVFLDCCSVAPVTLAEELLPIQIYVISWRRNRGIPELNNGGLKRRSSIGYIHHTQIKCKTTCQPASYLLRVSSACG